MEKSWAYYKNKIENQRQEAEVQNLRTPENSWLQGTLINKSSSKSLHTYTETKLHPRARAVIPATQEHSPELQYTSWPKSHQTHRHLKTHYWTLYCTPERRSPAPPTRTPTQASLIMKPWQATRPTPPTGRNLHNKEEPQTARIYKGHPKHSNLNKMKRQRNTPQVKEHNKYPPNQKKEEDVGSLPEKEFRIMIVKLSKTLKTKWSYRYIAWRQVLRRCKKSLTRT